MMRSIVFTGGGAPAQVDELPGDVGAVAGRAQPQLASRCSPNWSSGRKDGGILLNSRHRLRWRRAYRQLRAKSAAESATYFLSSICCLRQEFAALRSRSLRPGSLKAFIRRAMGAVGSTVGEIRPSLWIRSAVESRYGWRIPRIELDRRRRTGAGRQTGP